MIDAVTQDHIDAVGVQLLMNDLCHFVVKGF